MVSSKFIPVLLAGFLLFASPSFADNPSATLATSTPAAQTKAAVFTNEEGITSDPVCDPDVFTRMKQKAWMEAQRENYVNQSLILKPDSIFAITCYDKQLSRTMNKLNVKEKDDTDASKPTRFQTSVAANGAVADQFVGTKYGPEGEEKPVLTPNKNTPPPKGKDEAIPTTVESYSATPTADADNAKFTCNEMQNLWTQSQCGNFNSADLPSLTQVGDSKKESRKYPASCTAGKNDTGSGNDDYTYDKALAGNISGGDTTLPNYNNTNLYPCQKEPYSKLASFKKADGTSDLCPVKAQGDRCWQGNKTGQKSPKNKNVDVISCPNQGCVGEIKGDVMVCVPQKNLK